jgi:proline dehydrogenase
VAELRPKSEKHLNQTMHGVVKSQRRELIVGVGQRLVTYLYEFLQEISVLLHDVENHVERYSDDFRSLQRYRTVLTRMSGSTKLPHYISGFADIEDELVAIFRSASDLHKPVLEEEKCLSFVSHIVNYLIFLEGRHASIPQNDINEFSSNTPRQR